MTEAELMDLLKFWREMLKAAREYWQQCFNSRFHEMQRGIRKDPLPGHQGKRRSRPGSSSRSSFSLPLLWNGRARLRYVSVRNLPEGCHSLSRVRLPNSMLEAVDYEPSRRETDRVQDASSSAADLWHSPSMQAINLHTKASTLRVGAPLC